MALMHPRPEKAFVVTPEMMNQLKLYVAPPKPTKYESPSDWMNCGLDSISSSSLEE
jgi:hypothetical protein